MPFWSSITLISAPSMARPAFTGATSISRAISASISSIISLSTVPVERHVDVAEVQLETPADVAEEVALAGDLHGGGHGTRHVHLGAHIRRA